MDAWLANTSSLLALYTWPHTNTTCISPIDTSPYFKYAECPRMGGRTVISWLVYLLSLRSFPHGSFSYEDTDGFWVLGGTEGSMTFKGIIGHTRIYRRHLLFPNQVDRLIHMVNCICTKGKSLAHTNCILQVTWTTYMSIHIYSVFELRWNFGLAWIRKLILFTLENLFMLYWDFGRRTIYMRTIPKKCHVNWP